MGMSDAAIHNYLAEVRKWPKRPTDYDAQTEDIIRRILNGDIQPPYGQVDDSPDQAGTGAEAKPDGIREPAAPDEGAAKK